MSSRGHTLRGSEMTRGEMLSKALADPNEDEAFAQILYSAFGGFVDWEVLPDDGHSKHEYREKARHLLRVLDHYREQHGRVTVPAEVTPAGRARPINLRLGDIS